MEIHPGDSSRNPAHPAGIDEKRNSHGFVVPAASAESLRHRYTDRGHG